MPLYQEKTLALKWNEGTPHTDTLLALYGEKPSRIAFEEFARLKRLRGSRTLSPQDLPDLVTFVDMADPKAVTAVDPDNL